MKLPPATEHGQVLSSTARLVRPALEDRLEEQRAATGQSDRCKGLVRGRRAKKNGSAQCTNRAKRSGYCTVHEYQAGGPVRGQQRRTVLQRYQKIGESLHISPVTAMLSLLQEAAGNVEYYRRKVTELERLVIAGRKESQEVAKLVVLYNEERDRLQRYTADALRINLEARQTQISKQQAEALVAMVKAIVAGIGLVGQERDRALKIASSVLKEQAQSISEKWEGPFVDAEATPVGEVA